jgi:chitodextrinase
MPATFRLLVLLLALTCVSGWAGAESASPPAPVAEISTVAPNAAISNVTQNSFQVRWEPISGATRYELSYGTDPNAGNRGTLFVTKFAHLFTNLLPNTNYNVKVRAIVAGRAGAWSSIKSASTQIPVMTDLVADDVRDTTAHLTWSGIYSDLPDTVYEISYGTDPDASADGLISSMKNFITLKSLGPESTYFVKLRVRTSRHRPLVKPHFHYHAAVFSGGCARGPGRSIAGNRRH